jgi:hypothetical protein
MKICPEWWKRHFLFVELCLAVMLTACFIIWYAKFGGEASLSSLLKDNRSAIYGTAASVFGSLLGFVITATSIVLGFSASDRLKVLRESKQYTTLWSVFSSTIWALGLATTGAFLALIFDRDSHPVHFLLYIAFFGAVLSFLRVLRAVWVLENIIALLTAPTKQSKADGSP